MYIIIYLMLLKLIKVSETDHYSYNTKYCLYVINGMSVKFISGKTVKDEVSETYDFQLKNLSTQDANAIRRTILRDIQCLSFGKCQFSISETSFPELMIVGRIEAIPIKNVNTLHEGDVFTLEAKTPTNTHKHIVMTSDLIKKYPVLDGVIHPSIIIVTLKPGQSIKVNFELVKGSSAIHNRWCTVTAVGFRELDGADPMKIINGDDLINKSYELMIETAGVFSPQHILTSACDILVNNLQIAKITDTKSDRLTITSSNRIKITIPNDQHTICKAIATRLLLHKNVAKAVSITPDALNNYSDVHISGTDPIDAYNECITDLQNIFNSIKKQVKETFAKGKSGGSKSKSTKIDRNVKTGKYIDADWDL